MKIPLGIEIYSEIISDDFYNFLLKQYEKVLENKQYRYQNHNFFNGGDFNFLDNSHKKYYEENLLYHVNQYVGNTNYLITDQWINLQAHDDFVSLHEHSGSISYVIYLKIPSYLREQYSALKDYNHKGLPYSEGCIEFHYGIKTSLFSPSTRIAPIEKQILMFPSELLHYVYPFKNPSETRVSISGNLIKK